jgi:hypothetical protein
MNGLMILTDPVHAQHFVRVGDPFSMTLTNRTNYPGIVLRRADWRVRFGQEHVCPEAFQAVQGFVFIFLPVQCAYVALPRRDERTILRIAIIARYRLRRETSKWSPFCESL